MLRSIDGGIAALYEAVFGAQSSFNVHTVCCRLQVSNVNGALKYNGKKASLFGFHKKILQSLYF
jgi:hypothetical protein